MASGPPSLGDASVRALAAVIERRARRSSRGAGVALMFHDVSAEREPPRDRVVPPLSTDLLRAELEHLRDTYEVVSIHDLRARMASRRPGERFPVALTFDDDLSSHHRLVAPILREFGMPATFFLTGATLDGPVAFWWHDLDALFVRGGEHWRRVGEAVQSTWGPTGGELTLSVLARSVETLAPDRRDAFAQRLREILAEPPTDPGLSEDDVRALAAGGLEIGFHTRHHRLLQTLDDDRLHDAMREGAGRLSEATGRPLRAIAYPHCRPPDLRVAAAASSAGFEVGFICNDHGLGHDSHPLLLDRVDGWRPSLGSFAMRLARVIAAEA
jgi:peptidoglycan/xylan/chitin deacetylase (PgdA/CDA1 family)